MKVIKVMPVLIGIAVATQAHGDTRDDIVASIQRCGVMNDKRIWLDCVYGAIQPMRAELGLYSPPRNSSSAWFHPPK